MEVNGGETMRCIVQGKVIGEAWRSGKNGDWILTTYTNGKANHQIEVSAEDFKEDYAWMY